MTDAVSSRLIDRCYEAVHNKAAWSQLLEDFSDSVGSYTGAIFIAPIDGFSTIPFVVHNTAPLMKVVDAYSKYSGIAPFTHRAIEMGIVPGVFTTTDVISSAELLASEYYQEYMRPADVGNALTLMLQRGEAGGAPPICLAVARRLRAPDYSEQDRELAEQIFPHLRRSARMALHLEQSTGFDPAMGQAFDLMATPSILFGIDGRILHASRSAVDLCEKDRLLSLTTTELRISDTTLNAHLGDVLKRAIGIDRSWSGRSGAEIFIPGGPDTDPRVCVVVPLGPDNPFAGWISAVRAIVYIIAPGEPRASTDGLARIRNLYGLTRSEAEIGALLIAGKSTIEIARLRGVQVSSVRQQVKSVLLKTSCNRQAELGRLRPLIEGPG